MTGVQTCALPISFKLQSLIPAWLAGVRMMRPGDEWMLYVPAHLGYGAAGKSYIPPNSPLVFRVELVSVTPGPPLELARGRLAVVGGQNALRRRSR